MLIYRVQDIDGRGPWKPGFSHMWVRTRKDHNLLHPWYVEFPRLFLPENSFIGCGCKTIEQLKRWFTEPEYKTLIKYGYSAVKIDADNILAESEKQLVFERNNPLNYGARIFKLYRKSKGLSR